MDELVIKSRRDVPSVEILASDQAIVSASSALARPLAVEVIRGIVEKVKSRLDKAKTALPYRDLQAEIVNEISMVAAGKIARVINGTGILVHTNLGRAPLPEGLFESIRRHITGYGNVEFDILTGRRGRRGMIAEKYLALLSEAKAGAVVNNNAAALFLVLNTFAARRKVVISRGELVQIGGGFRIPDIIRKSGARLLEIGTSNITTLDDYRRALEEKPALILKVHRSNFSVTGFAEEVAIRPLVELGTKTDVPVINDLGSGVFVDTMEFIGSREPTVQSSVRDGAALTCFSGDKLLGGVQAGLIVGRQEMIARVKKNPVFRAMRVDKTVFSALEELLGFYLDGTWKDNIKLWRLAGIREAELYQKGRRLLREIDAGDRIVLEGSSGQMGGGSLPEVPLPSVALVFQSRLSPQELAARFRRAIPPVIGRICNERFMIDLKAVDDDDLTVLTAIIRQLLPQL
ncbi:MAG: L-seryl-tRNA(Sec) selenium transferase [Candidatus Zixiibacteriota bacterium]|nr:MAG: L-seryl-tRNA(Sec) selenium transferase [candidate division Zixibacteria bacterium]